jgi:hypothetical protein
MGIGQTGSRFRRIGGSWGGFGAKSRASLTTSMAGANNDIVYRASVDKRGTVGNAIRVAHVVAGVSTPLSVAVSGNDVTVNVATNGSSAATSTAAQVIAAIVASAPASALITAENAAGNDGTGVVAAFALTNLTGGTEWTIGTSASMGGVGRH